MVHGHKGLSGGSAYAIWHLRESSVLIYSPDCAFPSPSEQCGARLPGGGKGDSTDGGGRSRYRYSGREDLVVTMLELTVLEQRRARYWRGRDRERASHRHLLHESDELMFWLEECLVQGLRIVPGWLMPRFVWLLARADSELPRQIGGERRPAELIEILYRAQERLMEQSVSSRKPARIIPLFRKRTKR